MSLSMKRRVVTSGEPAVGLPFEGGFSCRSSSKKLLGVPLRGPQNSDREFEHVTFDVASRTPPGFARGVDLEAEVMMERAGADELIAVAFIELDAESFGDLDDG